MTLRASVQGAAFNMRGKLKGEKEGSTQAQLLA